MLRGRQAELEKGLTLPPSSNNYSHASTPYPTLSGSLSAQTTATRSEHRKLLGGPLEASSHTKRHRTHGSRTGVTEQKRQKDREERKKAQEASQRGETQKLLYFFLQNMEGDSD